MCDSYLEEFKNVPSGSPVLIGHVFYKIQNRSGTFKLVRNWINNINSNCHYKPISITDMDRLYKKYTKRNYKSVQIDLKKPVSKIGATTSSSSNEAASTSSRSKFSNISTRNTTELEFYKKKYYSEKLKNVRNLRKIKNLNKRLKESEEKRFKLQKKLKEKKEKTNKVESRKIFYGILLSGCPIGRVPPIMDCLATITNYEEIFSDRTIRRMSWELGYFADFVTCHAVLQVETVTLVFDATTQDGIHVNCVILSTTSKSYLVSLEHLAGGTAPDYKRHICNSLKHLVEVYCQISDQMFDDCYKCLVGKITCTLTDRAPVNHATIKLLEEEWGKQLIELNCNLHPLEAASRTVKRVLFSLETDEEKNLIPGSECLAWKMILSLNNLKFSPQKGDIMDFGLFWEQKGIKKSDIPRIHGNRLNIIFHLGGLYFTHFQDIKDFLKKYKKPNKTQKRLIDGFSKNTTASELQVLGAIGKLLTGPWMHTFYTAENTEKSHHQSMNIIKNILNNIRLCIQEPSLIFQSQNDLTGNPLDLENQITKSVMKAPGDAEEKEEFLTKIKTCLEQIKLSILKQYEKTFLTVAENVDMDMMSARDHTMFAESIIGEFSQRKKSSPNASVAFISNLIKSKRNGVLELISDRQTHDTFQQILSLAVHHGRKIHSQSMEMQKATSKEILARSAQRKSTNEKKNRRKIDNIIKKLPDHSLDSITKAFPEIPVEKIITIQRLLHGTPDSMIIRHDWEINQVVVKYYGIIRNFIFPNYTIYYYQPGKYDQGNEENVNFSVIAADFLCEDLDFF